MEKLRVALGSILRIAATLVPPVILIPIRRHRTGWAA
jgi:hypothetical protein